MRAVLQTPPYRRLALRYDRSAITMAAPARLTMTLICAPGYRPTDAAWMMWNALLSALLVRASIVMIDGNPLHLDLRWQWQLAAETGATLMGASPGFLMACRKEGVRPAAEFDLSRLQQIGAVGSPLPAEGYRWVTEQFGAGVLLNVGSGGTDVCSGIVQGRPLQPVCGT